MNHLVLCAIIGILVLGVSACDSSDDNHPVAPNSSLKSEVKLAVDGGGIVKLNDTVKITVRYTLDYPYDHSWVGKFKLIGTFYPDLNSPPFELVSGEQSWTDEITSFEESEHTIVLRVIEKGQFLVDAWVGVVIEGNGQPGGAANTLITVW